MSALKVETVLISPTMPFARLGAYRALTRRIPNLSVWITAPRYSTYLADPQGIINCRVVPDLSIKWGPDKLTSISHQWSLLLNRYQPENVISEGLALPTMAAAIYCRSNGKHLIIWAGGTQLSENGVIPPKILFRKMLLGMASGVLGYGTAAREYLLSMGVPAERIHPPYNVVDNHWWSEQTSRWRRMRSPSGCLRVLFVGQMIERKRIDLVLQMARLCKSSNLSIHIDLVGSVVQKLKYSKLAQAWNLTNVTFHEEQSPENLAHFYAQADVLVLTGRDIWGLVVNEAMACGVIPVVSSRVECARDLIESDKDGFVVEFDDPEQVVGVLTRLKRDAGYRQLVSQTAYKKIQSFSPESWAAVVAGAINQFT